MRRNPWVVIAVLAGFLSLAAGPGRAQEEPMSGEDLFKQHCSMCHPAGGNIVKPEKTLFRTDLDRNKIKTLDDVVWVMRNPNLGMTRFHVDEIPDPDARRIARYVMETFR